MTSSGMHTGYGQRYAPGAPDCVISLHRQGGVWRAVVVRRGTGGGAAAAAPSASGNAGGGTTNGNGAAGLQVVSVHDLPADAAFAERLQQLVAGNHAEQVVRVLPGGTVILRPLSMPPMDGGDLEAALELQAEALLPASLPPHRRGSAVLPLTTAPGEYAAIAVGWPDRPAAAASRAATPAASAGGSDAGGASATAGGDRLPALPDEVLTSYTGESVALVELFARVPGAEGVAGVFDPANRSAEIVISRGGAIAVRTTRLPVGAGLRVAIDGLIAETALALGIDDPAFEEELGRLRDGVLEQVNGSADGGRGADSPIFVAPTSVVQAFRDRVGGVPRSNDPQADLTWWRRYGIATLAGLGVYGPRASVFDLQADAPKPPTSPILRFAYWISSPRRAAAVLVAMVLIALGAPWLSAYARNQVVQSRFGHVPMDEATSGDGLTATDLTYYAALERERWPVLKVVADICNAADQHIQFQTVTMRQGEPVKITGVVPQAQSSEVYELVANLDGSGAYSGIIPSMRPNTAGQMEFEVTITVNDPYIEIAPRHDWYGVSLSEVLWGSDGTGASGDAETAEALRGMDGTIGDGGGGDFTFPNLASAENGTGGEADGNGSSGSRTSRGRSGSGSGSTSGESATTSRAGTAPSNARTGNWDVGGLGSGGTDEIPKALSDADIEKMSAEEVQEALKVRSLLKFRQSIDKDVRDRLNDEWRRLNTQRKKLADQAKAQAPTEGSDK